MGADAETLNQWTPAPALTEPDWTREGDAWVARSANGRFVCTVTHNGERRGMPWNYTNRFDGAPVANFNDMTEEGAKRRALEQLLAWRSTRPDTTEGTPALVADPINHPSHYTASPYEAITVIESVGSGYCRGNALKYLCRAPHKGSEAADLRKAAWYVRRLVTSREVPEPMDTNSARAVAASWAESGSVRYLAIVELLTGLYHVLPPHPGFGGFDALAAALEAEAERVGR